MKLKRLFSYIHGCDIQPKVTIHTIKTADRVGGISKTILQTPYYKSETQMGLLWKAKVDGKWMEFWNKEVGFFLPEEEAKIAQVLPFLDLPRNPRSKNSQKSQAKTASSNDRSHIAEAKQKTKRSSKA